MMLTYKHIVNVDVKNDMYVQSACNNKHIHVIIYIYIHVQLCTLIEIHTGRLLSWEKDSRYVQSNGHFFL